MIEVWKAAAAIIIFLCIGIFMGIRIQENHEHKRGSSKFQLNEEIIRLQKIIIDLYNGVGPKAGE